MSKNSSDPAAPQLPKRSIDFALTVPPALLSSVRLRSAPLRIAPMRSAPAEVRPTEAHADSPS
jgi:hypothetical protein